MIGLMAALWWAKRLSQKYSDLGVTRPQLDSFFTYAVIGVILGGRLGSVLFYNLEYYLANPLDVLKIYEGGMSFHGGFLGVCIAVILFCKINKILILRLGDILACVAPFGIFLGRLANFVNGELWGRGTDLPWGFIFPAAEAGGISRHPSQLYEAFLEGALLLVIANLLVRSDEIRSRPGLLSAVFLIGYGLSRILVGFTREPDAPLIGAITRGQFLSVPMLIVGLILVWRVGKANPKYQAS